MWNKLSDDFRMTCLHCGYIFNPYLRGDTMGHSPEMVFYMLDYKFDCPDCGHNKWTHNF